MVNVIVGREKNRSLDLIKKQKKNFFSTFRNFITENIRIKTNLQVTESFFFTPEDFHYQEQFTLKTKSIASNDQTNANILNNYFVNITNPLNIPERKPKKKWKENSESI